MMFQHRILTVGIVGMDELLFAERPVPRGGKGSVALLQTPGHFGTNVAVPFADAGHVSVLATVLGDDATAASLERFLEERGVELHAARVAGGPTASSHILIEGSSRTVYRTQQSVSEAWDVIAALDDLEPLATFDHLALGHLPADGDGSATLAVIRRARAAGLAISCTLGNTQLRLGAAAFAAVLSLIDLLVQNREEAVAFAGLPAETDAASAARALGSLCDGRVTVVVTDGGHAPAAAFDPETGAVVRAALDRVEVVDPTGAGDAFHAGLVLGRLQGLPLPKAMNLASRMASQTCTFWGGVARQAEPVAV